MTGMTHRYLPARDANAWTGGRCAHRADWDALPCGLREDSPAHERHGQLRPFYLTPGATP